MIHNHIAVFLQDAHGHKEMETTGQIVGPQGFPQTEHVGPFKLPLVPDQQHAEKEEEVGAIGGLQVEVELGVHQLHEMVEREELGAHARLVAEEVLFLTLSRFPMW